MGGMWMAFAWLLSFNADNALGRTLATGSWIEAVCNYLGLIIVSPWPAGLLALAAAGFYYFSDYQPFRWRLISGLLHAAAHFVTGTALAVALACVLPEWGGDALLVFLVFVGGWFLSGLVFGIYLLVSVLGRHAHSNEAFSALSIEGYKNFLRLRIGGDGALTIYPIGLTSVPNDRGERLTNPPLQPHLIESPIRVA